MKKRSARVWLAMVAAVMLVPGAVLAQEAAPADRKVVVKVLPQYPGLARAMKIQGLVRADVVVEPNGKVKSVDVKGGHPLLAQSAQDALREWKWEPAAHETHQTVELKFAP
jgi:TonB family protein